MAPDHLVGKKYAGLFRRLRRAGSEMFAPRAALIGEDLYEVLRKGRPVRGSSEEQGKPAPWGRGGTDRSSTAATDACFAGGWQCEGEIRVLEVPGGVGTSRTGLLFVFVKGCVHTEAPRLFIQILMRGNAVDREPVSITLLP
jgi:hypothetical protein